MMYGFLMIAVLAAHMFGDFVFQTPYIAANKKKNVYILGIHSFIYSYLVNSAFLVSYWICRIMSGKPILDYDSIFLWFNVFLFNLYIHCLIDHPKQFEYFKPLKYSPFMVNQVLHLLVLVFDFIVYTKELSYGCYIPYS